MLYGMWLEGKCVRTCRKVERGLPHLPNGTLRLLNENSAGPAEPGGLLTKLHTLTLLPAIKCTGRRSDGSTTVWGASERGLQRQSKCFATQGLRTAQGSSRGHGPDHRSDLRCDGPSRAKHATGLGLLP